MVDVNKILLILFAHFISDFVLQSDKMAINKSKSNYWLTIHVLNYGCGLFVFSQFILNPKDVLIYTFINMALHLITDYFTSRLNSYLWRKEMRYWFFVGIGADQLIHYTCLLLTYKWLL